MGRARGVAITAATVGHGEGGSRGGLRSAGTDRHRAVCLSVRANASRYCDDTHARRALARIVSRLVPATGVLLLGTSDALPQGAAAAHGLVPHPDGVPGAFVFETSPTAHAAARRRRALERRAAARGWCDVDVPACYAREGEGAGGDDAAAAAGAGGDDAAADAADARFASATSLFEWRARLRAPREPEMFRREVELAHVSRARRGHRPTGAPAGQGGGARAACPASASPSDAGRGASELRQRAQTDGVEARTLADDAASFGSLRSSSRWLAAASSSSSASSLSSSTATRRKPPHERRSPQQQQRRALLGDGATRLRDKPRGLLTRNSGGGGLRDVAAAATPTATTPRPRCCRQPSAAACEAARGAPGVAVSCSTAGLAPVEAVNEISIGDLPTVPGGGEGVRQ